MNGKFAILICFICLAFSASAAQAQTAVDSITLDPNGDSNGNGLSVPMPGFSASRSVGLSSSGTQGLTGSGVPQGSSETPSMIESLGRSAVSGTGSIDSGSTGLAVRGGIGSAASAAGTGMIRSTIGTTGLSSGGIGSLSGGSPLAGARP
jgi:hypothetical protein